MPGSPKERLTHESVAEETSEDRELYLRDGRTLVVSETGGEQLVEIRSASGMVEVRVRLTEQGPVLQMEAARLELKASEAVEIESPRVAIKTTEDVEIAAEGEVRVVGKKIHLN
jgi:hypothetical protein